MKASCTAVFALLLLPCSIIAQEQTVRAVKAGILNGRAVSLPKPAYPETARNARIGGVVAVDVLIDEFGTVVFAKAEPNDKHVALAADGSRAAPISLDPALREAAETAARKATFTPARLNGQPVKVIGKILYNFVADDSDQPPRVGEIYGPSLNDNAVSLPMPVYPDAARTANIQGTVTVHVKVDEAGNVISATATGGHPLLRQAAEEAAMQAKFKPSLFAGQPEKFAGVVTYSFFMNDGKKP